jgi:hypothetical protein
LDLVRRPCAAKSLKHSANAVSDVQAPKRPLHLTTRNHHPQSYPPPLKFLPRDAISSTAFTHPHSIIGDHVLFRASPGARRRVFDGRPAWNSCIDDPLHRSGHHLFLKRNSIQTSPSIKYPLLKHPTSSTSTASNPPRHGRTDTATQLPSLPPCPSRTFCKIRPPQKRRRAGDKHTYKQRVGALDCHGCPV